eukprot:8485814-Lingulodinium_polyedra.AAC.1
MDSCAAIPTPCIAAQQLPKLAMQHSQAMYCCATTPKLHKPCIAMQHSQTPQVTMQHSQNSRA